MVVLIPDCDELRTPMALIDGIIPNLTKSQSALKLHNEIKLSQYTKIPTSTFFAFESLSSLANSLEGRMTNEHFKTYKGNNLHQYLIYHDAAVKDELANSNILSGKISLMYEDNVFKKASNSHYCINIISDPQSIDQNRLKSYLTSWLSITQFQPLKKNDYDNYDKFEEFCDSLFRRIDDVYNDPIGTGLEGTTYANKSDIKGMRINP